MKTENKSNKGVFLDFTITKKFNGDLLASAIYSQMLFFAKDGKVEFSVSKFAKELGANRNTVNNKINKMIDHKLIKFVGKGWRNKSIWEINELNQLPKSNRGTDFQLLKDQTTPVAQSLDNSVAQSLDNTVVQSLDNSILKPSKTNKKPISKNELQDKSVKENERIIGVNGNYNKYGIWKFFDTNKKPKSKDSWA